MSTEGKLGGIDRRRLLQFAAIAPAVSAAGSLAQAAPVATKARIVIAGAGAGGLAVASRLATALDGAKITLIDERKAHYYQPGYTLVAAGLKSPEYTISATKDYVARGVELIEESVAEFDPAGNTVTTSKGRKVPYDYLVVATGLKLDYGAIEGMDTRLIGKDGRGSVYASPEAAQATWRLMSDFADKGGIGLFGRPGTDMKCAGAPLKYAFITDDYLRRRGTRGRAELNYYAPQKTLFGVPIVAEKVRMLFGDRGINFKSDHNLVAIDPGKKIARYRTLGTEVEAKYDFIAVVPPMRAPDAVRNSDLKWKEGGFAADGWMEVDRTTMQHKRFPNVFGVGDVTGIPKGKTAASVKWQVPVVVDHLVATIANKTSTAAYNGYTSCPLITRVGRAMLIEFDYNDNLIESFPGLIAPLEELWITWVMKETALKPTYLSMLRGKA